MSIHTPVVSVIIFKTLMKIYGIPNFSNTSRGIFLAICHALLILFPYPCPLMRLHVDIIAVLSYASVIADLLGLTL